MNDNLEKTLRRLIGNVDGNGVPALLASFVPSPLFDFVFLTNGPCPRLSEKWYLNAVFLVLLGSLRYYDGDSGKYLAQKLTSRSMKL